jgi:TctA family transporter
MIQMKSFYGIASGLMALSVCFSVWNLTTGWAFMNLPSKLSYITGSIVFQALLVIVFIGMYKVTPSLKVIDDPELDKILESISKKEVQNHG